MKVHISERILQVDGQVTAWFRQSPAHPRSLLIFVFRVYCPPPGRPSCDFNWTFNQRSALLVESIFSELWFTMPNKVVARENRGKSYTKVPGTREPSMKPHPRAISHRLDQRTKTSLRTNEYEYARCFCALTGAIEKDYGKSNFQASSAGACRAICQIGERFYAVRGAHSAVAKRGDCASCETVVIILG